MFSIVPICRYGTLPGIGGGYVPSEDYDDITTINAGDSLMQAPGGAELNRPLQQEVWFHGPVCGCTAKIGEKHVVMLMRAAYARGCRPCLAQ